MCGIAGAWTTCSADVTLNAVTIMNTAMAHRGPDDVGAEVIDTGARCLALGNRRLAIQDLSPAGHQPMHDPATGNVIVYNGEVYNFRDLAADLTSIGVALHSGSDTEVLLQAYAHWGLEETLRRARGMYALALWDAARHELILARDRVGVKPLYYATTAQGLVFASEIRAMLETGLVPRGLSAAGLNSYLMLGAVQEPHTMIEGVQQLPSGCYATVTPSGELTIKRYWSLEECFHQQDRSVTRAEAVEGVREHLRESVRLRLVSDAPAGVFLSGGLDSSAVVSLAAQAGVGDIRTVSVTFPEQTFSEEPYIRRMAERFGTTHSQIELSSSDLLGMLPQALTAMDQPTFDGVNTFVVAKQARAAGLTVALSGIGGDELFGGYPSFKRVPRLQTIARATPVPVGKVAARVLTRMRDDDQIRKLGRWLAREDLDDGACALARELFGPADRASLAPEASKHFRLVVPAMRGAETFNRVSCFELTHYLRNVLLRDTDVLGMAHGLEIREPLLDHELIGYVASLSGRVKAEGSTPKSLLADALGDDLPPWVSQRRKMGFVFPFAEWLRGPLRGPVRTALLDPGFGGEIGRALDAQAVADVWQRFQAGAGTWVRPWALYTLKCWGERHLA